MMEDHPRVCGEQRFRSHPLSAKMGSPPRVRGTVLLKQADRGQPGITPACAGNRRSLGRPLPILRDHPRVCGEQMEVFNAKKRKRGSPPRVRGTDPNWHFLFPTARITPACAGNRLMNTNGYQEAADHPRVCGEQLRGNAARFI